MRRPVVLLAALGLTVLFAFVVLAGYSSPQGPATGEVLPAVEWSAVDPPQLALRRSSLTWGEPGFVVLGSPTDRGTTIWTSADGRSWMPGTLETNPLGMTLIGDELVAFGGYDATVYEYDEPTWSASSEIELPAFARTGYYSRRPALVVVGDDVFVHSVDGELFHRRASGDFELVVEKGTWWAPETDPWARFTAPLVRNSCRPPVEASLDYPPLLSTPHGFVALVPLEIGGPNLTWPVCDPQIWFSQRGSEWSVHADPSGFEKGSFVYDVATSSDGFLAVGGVGPTQPALWRSADGVSWTRLSWPAMAEPFALVRIEAGPPGLVIVGHNSAVATDRAWFSLDGLCWQTLPAHVDPGAVAVGATSVVVADAGPDGALWVGEPTGQTDVRCDVDADPTVD